MIGRTTRSREEEEQPMEAEAFPERVDLLDRQLTYTLARIALGANLFLYGTSGGAIPMFLLEDAALPLSPFLGTMLALLTAGLGLLLVLGLWTRPALIAGGALVSVLVMAAAPRADVETLTGQMVYLAMFYLLPPASPYNVFSVDALLRKFCVGSFEKSS